MLREGDKLYKFVVYTEMEPVYMERTEYRIEECDRVTGTIAARQVEDDHCAFLWGFDFAALEKEGAALYDNWAASLTWLTVKDDVLVPAVRTRMYVEQCLLDICRKKEATHRRLNRVKAFVRSLAPNPISSSEEDEGDLASVHVQ